MDKRRRKYFVILIHITAWCLLLGFNLYVVFLNFSWYALFEKLVGLVLAPIIFYLNFLVFTKKFLFTKKIWRFILISGSLFISFCLFSYIAEKKINEMRWNERRAMYMQQYNETKNEELLTRPVFNDSFIRRATMQDTMLSIYLIISAYAIAIIIPFVIRWVETEKRLVKQEKEKLESELKYLKGQINPHFLFNSLNNIYALASRKSENTTEALLKLSAILRYVLYESALRSVRIEKEIENIENYISLQKLRITDKVKVNYNFNIPDGDIEIEPLIIIPLIENVFKYGVDSTKGSEIFMDLEIVDNILTFKTENTIVTPAKESFEKESGIGLKNVTRRLELTYASGASLDYFEKDGVFYTEMKINLSEHAMYSS